MPHVVIRGPVDLACYAESFEPLRVRVDGDVLRADTLYLERSNRAVLIEALAVESGRKLPFYIKVSARDGGGATVRIDPQTHPERSEGVKRIVAEVGADLLRRTPGARLERTNLVLPSDARVQEQPGRAPDPDDEPGGGTEPGSQTEAGSQSGPRSQRGGEA